MKINMIFNIIFNIKAPWYKSESKPENNWPEKGLIKFENYSTRYRPGLDLVLKELTVSINPGQRVGVGKLK